MRRIEWRERASAARRRGREKPTHPSTKPDTTGLGLAGIVQNGDQARQNSQRQTKARPLTPKGKFL